MFDEKVRDSQGTRDNVYLQDGALVLRSQRQQAGDYNFTSGAVETQGKVSWKGLTRACVSAKLPGGQGQPPPNLTEWCATTPFGQCRTGCPAGARSGTCGPNKQQYGPGVPCPAHGSCSCNKCICNHANTTCPDPGTARRDSQGVWPAHWMMPDNNACWCVVV